MKEWYDLISKRTQKPVGANERLMTAYEAMRQNQQMDLHVWVCIQSIFVK